MRFSLSALVFALVLCNYATAINQRTSTPPMGWNSYNYYSCYPNETLIKENAKGLVDLGFAAKGYTIVTPDCGWASRNRTADDQITWNTTLFPSGFPALGEYIHGLGLKFGLYSGAGVWQCDPDNGAWKLQASLGHEVEDAQTFASWGGDALKYDNCWANALRFVDYTPSERDPSVRFATMADALDAVNRSIVYEICQWGVGENLGVWAPKYGDSWRISNDIQDNWKSIWRIVNQVVPYFKHTGVGKYADMDMLTIGLNALSLEEERFHLTLWAINKSPLIIGAPMDTNLTKQESLDILSNSEVIAINQDALGEQARLIRRYTEAQYDIWAGNLSSGRKVLAVPNWSNDSTTISVNLDVIGASSAGNVRDVWAGNDLGSANSSITVSLSGHEAKLLVLSTLTSSSQRKTLLSYYAAASGTLTGDAEAVNCSADACQPAGSKVANLTVGSSTTLSDIDAGTFVPPGYETDNSTRLLALDYTNYDVALATAWTNGTNTRNITLAVNGGAPVRWALPISGGDWDDAGRLDIEVGGFEAGGGNEVVLEAPGVEEGVQVVGVGVYGLG